VLLQEHVRQVAGCINSQTCPHGISPEGGLRKKHNTRNTWRSRGALRASIACAQRVGASRSLSVANACVSFFAKFAGAVFTVAQIARLCFSSHRAVVPHRVEFQWAVGVCCGRFRQLGQSAFPLAAGYAEPADGHAPWKRNKQAERRCIAPGLLPKIAAHPRPFIIATATFCRSAERAVEQNAQEPSEVGW
jgi:hypothetical protein